MYFYQFRYMINDGNLVLAFAIICSLSVTRIYLVVKVPIKFITFRLSPSLPKLYSPPFTLHQSPHLSRPTSKTWPTRQFTSGFERLFLSRHLLCLPSPPSTPIIKVGEKIPCKGDIRPSAINTLLFQGKYLLWWPIIQQVQSS